MKLGVKSTDNKGDMQKYVYTVIHDVVSRISFSKNITGLDS